MPRIKRWFPVSQDIHADPEFWELRDTFGDRAGFIWLEILSIADRNAGELPGQWDSYPTLLAARCRSSRTRVRLICEWLQRWVEVDSEGHARIVNYAKYHRSEERKPIPTPENIRFLPSEPSEPNLPKEKYKEKETEIPDWIPSEPWEAYLKHRKHKRAKVTPEAAKGLIEKLLELKEQGEDVTAILKQSVTNGWTGLFPVAGNGQPKPKTPFPGDNLQTSQVPIYKPAPLERRANPEIQAGLKKLVDDLTTKLKSP